VLKDLVNHRLFLNTGDHLSFTCALQRNQVFMMALGTLHPRKTVFQPAAFEVISKFLLHMQGLALLGHHIPKRRVILLDDLIEKCPF
jgi:hypothetical protein